jgi:protein-S-isoprenylcysteine O-methyltransferase Ste14
MHLEDRTMQVATLVGSGDRIGRATLPFVVVGLALNVAFPTVFSVGGPPGWLRALSLVMLVIGLIVWAWSAALILRHVPGGELITTGPYRLVRHPLYTGVALLVLPATGFLLDSWLGAAIGLVLYLASRRYAPEEERQLASRFGDAWVAYRDRVAVPWI